MRRFFLTLFTAFALSLFWAGCSQSVSNSADGEVDDSGFMFVNGDWEYSEWGQEHDYPLDFNANLIVVGNYTGTSDGATVEELAKRILDRLNMGLNPGGVSVRKVNVLFAKEHPVVGADFAGIEVMELGKEGEHEILAPLVQWPGHEGEVDFILGHHVYEGMGSDGVEVGYSPSPGVIYSEAYPQMAVAGYIAIVTHGKGEIKRGYTATQIANVALHELGHFFGLSHTSEIGGTKFDDIDDTPECRNMVMNNLDACEDRNYLMFPLEQMDWSYASFSPQQMKVIQSYLATVPHI